MDPRLTSDDEDLDAPKASPIPQQEILWSSPVVGAVQVGDQDGTEFREDGDFLGDDTVAPNFESFRLILPPFIQMGYRIIPPMMKNPPARVSIGNATRLANQIVDCAYQDPDLADALAEFPDDCKIGLGAEAIRIYIESPKLVKENERSDTLPDDRSGGRRGRDRVRDPDGSGGTDQRNPKPSSRPWDFDLKSSEAKYWGFDGGFWK